MRFTGIEFRRRDGSRFDFTDRAPAHRALRGLHELLHPPARSAAPPSSARATARASATWSSAPPRSTARPTEPGRVHRAGRILLPRPDRCCYARGKGECFRVRNAPQPAAVASVLCHGAAALSVPIRKGRAQAVHRAAGRRRLPPERRAVAPGLPPLAERALPPVLRRLLGLPLRAHRRRATSGRAAASGGCCGATPSSSASRAAPGPPTRSTPCSAATSTPATPPAAWPTWT